MTQEQKFVIAGLFFVISMLCVGLLIGKVPILAAALFSCLCGIVLLIDGWKNTDD